MSHQRAGRPVDTAYETGWDLGPIASRTAPGYSPPQATKCNGTNGTKNNCMHVQLGQILDKRCGVV